VSGIVEADQPYVFLSYASADLERVRRVADALSRAGVAVWRDQEAITGGTSYGPAIATAIRGCHAVLVLCSEHSLASRNVRQEIAIAWKHERPCLPLLLDPVTTLPEEVEYWLEGTHWIEVFDHPPAMWLPRVSRALDRLMRHDGAGKAQPNDAERSTSLSIVPSPPSSFVGREREVAEVAALLRQDRIVTLTGPGGIGKTRIAIFVGHHLADEYRDGVTFVDLAPLHDSALVLPAIAAALGVHDSGETPLADTLVKALRPRQALLIVDNFEQVVGAAGDISKLVSACPSIVTLMTSRAALRIAGEVEYTVAPLPLPEQAYGSGIEQLRANPSVALFVQRARSSRPNFALTAENADAIVTICERLDGLPLAIELAAARTRLLSPVALVERLTDPLQFLSGGSRDLPERQQTIRKTIQWSHDLLSANEQRLLRRLSVFAGGWTLPSAEEVVNHDGTLGLDCFDGIASLVEKSLVTAREQPDGVMRCDMLAIVREFAGEQLTEDDSDALGRAHAAHFLSRLDAVDVYQHDVSMYAAIEIADQEFPNLRAAIDWGLKHDIELAASLIVRMHDVWLFRGRFREGQDVALAALSRMTEPTATRARLLTVLANFDSGSLTGRAAVEEAVGIARSLGDDRLLARILRQAGDLLIHRGEVTLARARYNEALALSRACGDGWTELNSLMGLGGVAFVGGAVDEGLQRFEGAVALARNGSEPVVWGFLLSALGDAYVFRGDHERAVALYREMITQPARYADVRYIVRSIEGIARIAAPTDPIGAATLFGAAQAARDRIAYNQSSVVVKMTADPNAVIDAVRQTLGAEGHAEPWGRGQRMSLDDAIAYAMELTNG
jgi:predicted ATPase